MYIRILIQWVNRSLDAALSPQLDRQDVSVAKLYAAPAPSLIAVPMQKGVVATLAFAGFLASLMQALIVPLMPGLPRLLNATPSETTWVVTSTLLSGAVGSVILGRLGDTYGKKRMLVLSLTCLIVGSIIGALATSAGLLILARSLQGVAMAVVPVGISALRDVVAGNQLIKSIAALGAMVVVGGSLGLSLAACAAQFFEWQWLFWGSAFLGSMALIAVSYKVPSIPSADHGHLDVLGVLGLAAGVVGLLVGISNGNAWGWASPVTLFLLVGSCCVLFFWGLHEVRQAEPLIDLHVASRRPVFFTNLATVMVGIGMYGMILALPQLIQLPASTGVGLGQSILTAGLCMAPGGIACLLLTAVAARMTNRHGPRFSMVLGALLMAGGYGVLIAAHDHLWQLIVSNVVTSAGVSLCFVAAPALLLRHVEGSVMGQANGLNNLARSLGTTISSAVTAAILAGMSVTQGLAAFPSEDAFHAVFLVSGSAAVLICVFMGLAGRVRHE
ncbi:MFS transporter [Pseudarthrobacter sp. NPDC058329]|uniref:MFS transporter n=1 Tax=Pseudarthrobacter sp. NPDC058329 TaxID=3346448 RepID=UPI0036DE0310